MKLKKAKFIKTKKSIKANVFDFRKDEVVWVNNKKLVRDYIKHNGVTSIVPIFEKKNIILLRQYRYGSDEIMYEVPAGTIDTGEKPLSCAKRELREETGYTGKNWKSLGSYYPSPAYNSCQIFCYQAECIEFNEQNLDEDEVLEVKIKSFNEVKKMLDENFFKDMKTYISLNEFFKNY
jgi:ADP-ribose pyrophosphatase